MMPPPTLWVVSRYFLLVLGTRITAIPTNKDLDIKDLGLINASNDTSDALAVSLKPAWG